MDENMEELDNVIVLNNENGEEVKFEFLDLVDPTNSFPHICFFKNKCPIDSSAISSTIELSQLNDNLILRNIQLNSERGTTWGK